MRPLSPGMRLGQHRLEARLGAGATCEAWRARSKRGDVVVLKRPRPELAADPAFARKLVEEAALSSRLDHANVLRTLGTETLDGVPTLILEHVHGRDLRTLLAALAPLGAPPPGLGAFVGRALARALAHAHAHHVVHRDVSPANVLLGYDGAVKLADFGLAKAVEAAADGPTRTDALRGNLAYMPPEQLDGKPADPRADVYALAVLLHETLCAKRLFRGPPDPSHMKALRRLRIHPPSAHNPAVPPELDALVARGMSPDPAARPTAGALASALDSIVAALGFDERSLSALLGERLPDVPAPEPEATAARITATAAPQRRRATRTAAWLAAAALALAGGAFAASRFFKTPPPIDDVNVDVDVVVSIDGNVSADAGVAVDADVHDDVDVPDRRPEHRRKRAGTAPPNLPGGKLLDPFHRP